MSFTAAPSVVTAAQLKCLARRFRKPNYNRFHPKYSVNEVLAPLAAPLREVLCDVDKVSRSDVITTVLEHVLRTSTAYGVWSAEDWADCFRKATITQRNFLHAFALAAYRTSGLLIADILLSADKKIVARKLAATLFGLEVVEKNIDLICEKLISMGYAPEGVVTELPAAIAEFMLVLGEPDVMRWLDPIQRIESSARGRRVAAQLHAISVALVALGVVNEHTQYRAPFGFAAHRAVDYDANIDPEWRDWSNRWLESSRLEGKRRVWRQVRRVGHWLHARHPSVKSPLDWDTRFAAQFVAAVCDWKVGDYLPYIPDNIKRTVGQELTPNTKRSLLIALRTFFLDLQSLTLFQCALIRRPP